MSKFEQLDSLLQKNNGFLKTSDVVNAGISKPHFAEYIRRNGLERVSHGLYMSQDAWMDGMYQLQTRYPQIIFSHETALYLLKLADREPLQYTATAKNNLNTTNLKRQNVKVYKVTDERYSVGVIEVQSPAGHTVRAYNPERTVCDLIRSRSGIEIQDLQTALKEYVRYGRKNLSLLMEYAKIFKVEKILKQYLEVLL